MDVQSQITQIARHAREAAPTVARLETEKKNDLLLQMADALEEQAEDIQKTNTQDVTAAQASGKHTKAAIDRLVLNETRIKDMSNGLREIADLPDPLGQIVKEWTRPNGLIVKRVRIPLGVIGMIYESRPNVTVDAAGLCLKSGNAIVLRGGSEAIHSNTFLGNILRTVCEKNDVDPNIIQVIPITDREAMKILVQQTKYIDLMIPRGGEALMKWMAENSQVPVIKHDKGVCHVYVDAEADLKKAEDIAFNSKVQRPGVCNAMETLLVHEKVAKHFIPMMTKRYEEVGVEIRGDETVRSLYPQATAATKNDWNKEYLDLVLAVRVVPSLEAAMDHIEKYGSLHTEAIVTENQESAERFQREVDSSCVVWNASTRFNDGGQLGLGAEIGISTSKTHAFGPMGLEELTTTKFVVTGTGQIRQ
jgi:glutamate-5-semialdehyde dehydrogenase